MSPIVIGTFSRAIDYAPYYVARRFGWFRGALAEVGDSVTFREFNSREQISAAFDAGSLHVIFAAEIAIIITRAQGTPLQIFELSCTLQQEILVRNGVEVRAPSDLRGLRIAVLEGTSSHYGLLRVLDRAGLEPGDVGLVFQGPTEAQASFEGGSVDAWAVWPPFVEEQQIAGQGYVLQGGDAVIQSVAAVSQNLSTSRSEATSAIAAVIRRAKTWILDNPDEAQEIVARALNLDPVVVELAWGKHDWASRMTDDFVQDIAAKVDFLRESDQLRRTAPAGLEQAVITLEFGGGDALSR